MQLCCKALSLNQRWRPGGVLGSPLALALADSAELSVSEMSLEANIGLDPGVGIPSRIRRNQNSDA